MTRWVTALFIVITSFYSSAEQQNSIHWLHSEMPPAHILNGEHKNTGYADLTVQLIAESLNQYTHIMVPANYKRTLLEMQERENVCHAALLKNTEREKHIIYSVPAYLISANKLFVLPAKQDIVQPYITAQGKVDLESLLTKEKFILGVSSGGKYGEIIDGILNRLAHSNKIIKRTALDHYSGLSGMLEKETWLDGFLGLPIENKFYQLAGSTPKKSAVSYSIERSDEFLVGYVGCSKSEFGKQAINEINNVILSERTKKIKNYYQSWLRHEDVMSHQKLIDSQF